MHGRFIDGHKTLSFEVSQSTGRDIAQNVDFSLTSEVPQFTFSEEMFEVCLSVVEDLWGKWIIVIIIHMWICWKIRLVMAFCCCSLNVIVPICHDVQCKQVKTIEKWSGK